MPLTPDKLKEIMGLTTPPVVMEGASKPAAPGSFGTPNPRLPGTAGAAMNIYNHGQRIINDKKAQSIIDSVFGPQIKEPEKTGYAALFEKRRQAAEKERTDAVRMAKYNALGNALTTMVQPLGWAAGGATGGVQPYDNRAYLDAFNRAVKANDDIRNVGLAEEEYPFQLQEEQRQRDLAWEDFKKKQDYEYAKKSEYAKQRHAEELEKINARGENRMTLEQFKTKYKTTGRNGVPVEEKMLSTAWTRYLNYKDKHDTDVGRGITRENLPSFEDWVGSEYGWIIKPQGNSDGSASVSGVAASSGAQAASATSKTPPSKAKKANSGAASSASTSKTPPSKQKK